MRFKLIHNQNVVNKFQVRCFCPGIGSQVAFETGKLKILKYLAELEELLNFRHTTRIETMTDIRKSIDPIFARASTFNTDSPTNDPKTEEINETKMETKKQIISEDHREQLLMQAEAVAREQKSEAEKSRVLKEALISFMKKKGITFQHQQSSEEEDEAVEKYQFELDRLWKVNKQNEVLDEQIHEKVSLASEKKRAAVGEMDRLKDGE